MADAKTTALTAATSWASGDLLYMVSDPAGTPASRKITLDNVLSKIVSAANSKAIGVTGYSLTGSNASSMIDLAGTWNTSGNPVALKMAITNTASGATSKFISLLAGASGTTEVLSVDKTGLITSKLDQSSGQVSFAINTGANYGFGGFFNSPAIIHNGNVKLYCDGSGTAFYGRIKFEENSGALNWRDDLFLYRDAANTLGIRNSTNAQTFRTYGTYTDASNYRRVTLSMTTAGVATLLPEGAGTGASGNVLHISGLPTSNPGPGILWNNAGTPAIGT